MGFEPMNRGFADPRLRPLGYVAFKNLMVPRRRLELLQPSGHSALNAACLPIPPPRQYSHSLEGQLLVEPNYMLAVISCPYDKFFTETIDEPCFRREIRE